MGNLAITPAQVQPAGGTVTNGVAGEDVDAGEVGYYDAASAKWKLEDSGVDTNAAQIGIFENTAALGQPCTVCVDGPIEVGADAGPIEGVPYGVSPTTGKITALDDALMVAGEYRKYLGMGAADDKIELKPHSTDQVIQ